MQDSSAGCLQKLHNFLVRGTGHEPKHKGNAHPLICCVSVYVAMLVTGLAVDHVLFTQGDEHFVPNVVPAFCLLAYWILLISLRMRGETECLSQDIYHLMFSCNVSMPLGAVALLLRRPVLLCAQGVLVAIDQVLWYVDLLGYLLIGKLPIKVVGYLLWPTTPLSRKITCVHHLVFEPLVLICCSRWPCGVLVGRGFLVALAQTIICQIICRYTTPLEIIGPKDVKYYLNINLCHESFRDVKVAWIRYYDGCVAWIYLPWMLWIWNVGNLLLFLLLAVILLIPLRIFNLPGSFLAW